MNAEDGGIDCQDEYPAAGDCHHTGPRVSGSNLRCSCVYFDAIESSRQPWKCDAEKKSEECKDQHQFDE